MLKLISKKILFLFLLQLCYEAQSNCLETRANFLPQFLKNQASYSNMVIIHFCENTDSMIKFSKIMVKQFYFATFIRDTNDLQKFNNKTGNIFVLDEKCAGFKELFKKGYSLNLFGESNNWIIFAHNRSNVVTSDLRLEINSKIFEVIEDQDILSVRAVFKVAQRDNQILSNDITKWTAKNGFTYFNNLYLPGPRENLMGSPLKVSYYYDFDEILKHLTDDKEMVNGNSLKFIYILMEMLSDYLNATHVTSFTQKFGFSFDNKTQMFENNSMLGDVQQGFSDIVGSYLWVDSKRLRDFGFIALGISELTEFVFKAPTIPMVNNLFLLPFDYWAWYCIIISLLLGTILVHIILIYEKRFGVLRNDTSIVDVFMTLLSALLQKSWILEFRSYSGKFALAIIYLTFMIIYTAYSASIIVFLQGTSESIKSFKDLYDMNVDFAVNDVSYNRYYYLTPNNGRINEHWRSKIFKDKIDNRSLDHFFLSSEEGIRKVREGSFAFQCHVSTASYLIQKTFHPHEVCHLRFTSTMLLTSDLYLAVRKNCSFVHHYRVGISRLREHGLLKRSQHNFFTRKVTCEGASGNFSGIGLQEIRFIFVFCLSAFVASFFFLLLEVLVSKFERKHTYFEFVN